jgi:hypothetical protein
VKRQELQRLAGLSQSVRQATVSKFRAVPRDKENWRVDPGSLSFADYAQHILDLDQCFFKTLRTNKFVPCQARPGLKEARDRKDFENMIRLLEESQQVRWRLVKDFPEELLDQMPEDPTSEKITTWWSVIRGNLDYEIRLRDELAAALRKAVSS